MLQSIRDNSQSIVAKVIVGLIIITFALFGVESLVSLTAGSNAPAEVNGEEISQQELYQATELQRRQILAQMGEGADPTLLDDNLIQARVLDRLIEDKALLLSAKDQGMLISDRMVDQMILNTPDFELDGKFNRDQFEAVLRNAGFTPLMYRDLLKKERLLEQQKLAYELSAFTTSQELNRIATLDRQTRSAEYFILPLADFEKQVVVSDEEVQAEFDKRKAELLTDESVNIEYLLLDKAALGTDLEISAEDIKAEYDQLVASFQADEQRQVAHILFEINDNQDAAAALQKATAAKQRLTEGAEFAALANELSDDLGSAEQGGDLGVNGKGVFDPAFEAAMFDLAENAVSEPVKTDFGYHLIKVGPTIKTQPPTLAESQQKLKSDLLAQKVEGLYVEKMEQLADSTFSAGDLVEPSEVMNMPIKEITGVIRTGGEDDIANNPKVLAAVFSDELIKEGLNSAPIELDKDRTLVVRVKEHFEPREKTFAEVAEQLKQQLTLAKASEMLQSAAKEKLTALSSKTLAEVAGSSKVETLTDISRGSGDVPALVRDRLFAMPHPENDQAVNDIVTMQNGNLALLSLTAVKSPEVELSEAESQAMLNFLSARQGTENYQSVVKGLTDKATIERL